MSVPVKPLPAEDLDHVLAHTGKLWAGARGATFFITGGTGFFGMWLLESFAYANDKLALGMRAVVLTREPAAFARKAPHLAARGDLVYHQGDLRTFAFPAGRFTYLIHAAADTGVWTKNETADGMLDRLAAGMRHLLDFTAVAGGKSFLHVSSGAVYGPQPAGLTHLPEDHPGIAEPLPPGSAWAEGKRVAEQLCVAHASRHGYALKIARCFAFVGPHLDENYAIGNFIRDALRGGPIQVAGDGTPRRSYLYAADLVIWLWTLLFAAPPGRAYNIGSPAEVSIAELARAVAAASGEKLPVHIAVPAAPGRPFSRYVPAVDRAEVELGLRVWIPLAEAIRKTIAWQRSEKAAPFPMSPRKLGIAILGTGNIGTDLLVKVLRSPVLECRLFSGRNLSSPGMTKASLLNVPVSARGIAGIADLRDELALVFDATSALDHVKHAPLLAEMGLVAVDLTPAKVGRMCVPAVNLTDCLREPNINMITCGGQASIPLAHAIKAANPGVEYIEAVSSIASRSAGPATRINLDEYLQTTEQGLQLFGGCARTKAILNLNPAQPCVHMQTTVMAKIARPDLERTRALVAEMVARIKTYIPGYQLILEPMLEGGRLVTMVRVEGLGDYLPRYAGNLDIINCAAIAFAEAYARQRTAQT